MALSVGPIPGRFDNMLQVETSRRAVEVSVEARAAMLGGAATGADLGGSSKYSNENFED